MYLVGSHREFAVKSNHSRMLTCFQNRVFTAASLLGAALAIDNTATNGLSFVDTVTNQRLSIIGVECVQSSGHLAKEIC